MNSYEELDKIIILNNKYELVKNKVLADVFTSYKLNNIRIKTDKNDFCILPLRNKDCSICFNDVPLRTCKIFNCYHFICYDCYKEWNNSCNKNNQILTCPYCRNCV